MHMHVFIWQYILVVELMDQPSIFIMYIIRSTLLSDMEKYEKNLRTLIAGEVDLFIS